MNQKKTVVVGASPDPQRYSHRAVNSLVQKGIDVTAVGLHGGNIGDVVIHTDKVHVPDVDTVTLYVHPRHQANWKDYIFSLKPKRVVFNPGAENPAFQSELEAEGIVADESCTLVMLAVGTY